MHRTWRRGSSTRQQRTIPPTPAAGLWPRSRRRPWRPGGYDSRHGISEPRIACLCSIFTDFGVLQGLIIHLCCHGLFQCASVFQRDTKPIASQSMSSVLVSLQVIWCGSCPAFATVRNCLTCNVKNQYHHYTVDAIANTVTRTCCNFDATPPTSRCKPSYLAATDHAHVSRSLRMLQHHVSDNALS